MLENIKDGILTIDKWEKSKNSSLYKILTESSNDFYRKYSCVLDKYKKWSKNPIDQWSRIYEYPWVLSKLQEYNALEKDKKILDLGSGVTFFPYYLAENYEANIICVDNDKDYAEMFAQIEEGTVKFILSDILNIQSLDENTVNNVYCISVLEHLPLNLMEQAVSEIHKILEPKGKVFLTIDVSFDKDSEIYIKKLDNLWGFLKSKFELISPVYDEIKSGYLEDLTHKDNKILTTKDAYKYKPNSIPWSKPPAIKSFINKYVLGRKKPWLTNLSCVSSVWEKQ